MKTELERKQYRAQRDREQAVENVAEEFVTAFSGFCNNMNSDPRKAAVKLLMREHRTIQQNMMRFFVMFAENMAEQQSDMRNEASVKLAKEIVKLDHILPFV